MGLKLRVSGFKFLSAVAALMLFSGCAESVEVCMTSPVPMVEGAEGCLSKDELGALKTRQVMDANGPAQLALAHPTDFAQTKTVETCVDYEALAKEGWSALTSADMRREAAFARACSALSAMAEAEKPRKTHFKGGTCARSDVVAIPVADLPAFGEGDGASGPVTILADGAGAWAVETATSRISIQELAHADFDGDGVGDILCFVYVRAKGGSAAHGFAALLSKSAEGGAVRLTQL
ncbi:MAG: hypothetical protein AAGC95_11755 [Pseudomonadota bacterium]